MVPLRGRKEEGGGGTKRGGLPFARDSLRRASRHNLDNSLIPGPRRGFFLFEGGENVAESAAEEHPLAQLSPSLSPPRASSARALHDVGAI